MIFNIKHLLFSRSLPKLSKRASLRVLILLGIALFVSTVLYVTNFVTPQSFFARASYWRYNNVPNKAYSYLSLLVEEAQSNIRQNSDRSSNLKKIKLIQVIHTHVISHPDDINNSYHIENIGRLYESMGAKSQASLYYTKSLMYLPYNKNPQMNFKKIYSLSLNSTDINDSIKYNNILIENYSSKINIPMVNYTLGTLYDELGQWDHAYEHYRKMLTKTVNTTMDQEAIKEVFFRVNRTNKSKSYTWDTAENAKKTVYNALFIRNSYYLKSLQAPNFFTAHWEESPMDSNAQIPTFDIIPIFNHSNFRGSPKLTSFFSKNEVLWATYGWERVNTWNMVFRKIQQPDTIELNGKWEWAGIYFGIGNKLYVPEQYNVYK